MCYLDVMSNIAALGFDGFRSVKQGEAKTAKLFEDRSCERVLRSVNKSNPMVNILCVVLAVVSILGCLIALQKILASPATEKAAAEK